MTTRRRHASPAAAPPPFEAMPGHLIRRAHQIAVALFVEECGDMTPVQFATLAAVAQHPNIDATRLAGLIALDKPTTGGVIERLEAKGLVRRAADREDKRMKRLMITVAGQRMLAQALPGVVRTQKRLLAPLTGSEQREFLRLLGQIVGVNNNHSRAPHRPLPDKARLEAAE